MLIYAQLNPPVIQSSPPTDRLLHLEPAMSTRAFAAQLINLTPCYDDACTDYKSLATEVKDVHTANVREFAATTPRASLWFGLHGVATGVFMPEFAKAAIDAYHLPLLILNWCPQLSLGKIRVHSLMSVGFPHLFFTRKPTTQRMLSHFQRVRTAKRCLHIQRSNHGYHTGKVLRCFFEMFRHLLFM